MRAASNAPWHEVKKKPGSPLPDGLAERYEELRTQAAGRRGAAGATTGLALFLQRGMPAWMAAWSQCLPASAPALPKLRAPEPDLLPDTLRAQVVALLTEMALRGRREVGG